MIGDTCPKCGSKNTRGYDEGEEYPPVFKCKDCKEWFDVEDIAKANKNED